MMVKEQDMVVGDTIRSWRERRSSDQAVQTRLTGVGVHTPRRATVRKRASVLTVDPVVLWEMGGIHGNASTQVGGHDGR